LHPVAQKLKLKLGLLDAFLYDVKESSRNKRRSAL